jgi:hypothetical protein
VNTVGTAADTDTANTDTADTDTADTDTADADTADADTADADTADADTEKTEQDFGRGPAVPPWNRTAPLGARCRERGDCSRNGACLNSGGIGLLLGDHYSLIARTPDEDKWLHWVQVQSVDPGSVAEQAGVREGDFVEHIGSIRDDSAYDATQRLLKQFAKLDADAKAAKATDPADPADPSKPSASATPPAGVLIGLVRPPDPTLTAMRYGGIFNVSLALAPGEKLGLKLSNAHNHGIKVKKVHAGGAAAGARMVAEGGQGAEQKEQQAAAAEAAASSSPSALLKNDFIRKVNGVRLPSNTTIPLFVGEIKKARAGNASNSSAILLEIERPMPPKRSDLFNRLTSQHFTVVLAPPGKRSRQYSSLGNCACSGSWAGPRCGRLRVMAPVPVTLTHHSDEEYSNVINKYARVSRRGAGGWASRRGEGRGGDTDQDHDENSDGRDREAAAAAAAAASSAPPTESLLARLGDRRAASSFAVVPACTRVRREGAQAKGSHAVFHAQCDYHSYAAVPDAAPSPNSAAAAAPPGNILSYAVAVATSFSPFGPFYSLRISPWRITGDGPPSFARCAGLPSETYIAQVSLGRILVAKLETTFEAPSAAEGPDTDRDKAGASSSVEKLPTFAGAPALVSRPGDWDAHILGGGVHLSCVSSPPPPLSSSSSSSSSSASRTFVLAYAGASERGATTSMIGLAVSETWDGPYRRVDGPLDGYRETGESAAGGAVDAEVSPQGQSDPGGVDLVFDAAEVEAFLPPQGRIAQDGVVLTADANVSSLSDPFLYVHETDGAPPSFHLLLMARSTKEKAAEAEEEENMGVEEPEAGSGEAGEDDATAASSDGAIGAARRCDQAVFHAHAPSLAGPWTLSKAASSDSGRGDESDDHSSSFRRHAGAALSCRAFAEWSGNGDRPNPVLSSSSSSAPSNNDDDGSGRSGAASGVGSAGAGTHTETTRGFGRPRLVHMQNEQGFYEPIAFYALLGAQNKPVVAPGQPARPELEATVFGAACAHN